MEHDPQLNDLTDPLDRGLVFDIRQAPGWKPAPFKVALFYTTAEMARILKVDPSTEGDFEREGLPSFAPVMKGGRRTVMPYRKMPERLHDDPEELSQWAARALVAAQRKAVPKKTGAKAGKSSRKR